MSCQEFRDCSGNQRLSGKVEGSGHTKRGIPSPLSIGNGVLRSARLDTLHVASLCGGDGQWEIVSRPRRRRPPAFVLLFRSSGSRIESEPKVMMSRCLNRSDN